MAGKASLNRYTAAAVKLGALDAKIIPADSIVTGEWVRLKCQFGCSGYGATLTCPPYSPAPEHTARVLQDYRRALFVHGDDNTDVSRIAIKLEREIFLDGYYKAFAMGAGPCGLCRTCTLKYCRQAEKARPSMEACGIDVYQTARNNRFPIQVVKDLDCGQDYYSLVLIE